MNRQPARSESARNPPWRPPFFAEKFAEQFAENTQFTTLYFSTAYITPEGIRTPNLWFRSSTGTVAMNLRRRHVSH